jgi:hypothetical protein
VVLAATLVVGAALTTTTDHAAEALSSEFGSSRNIWIARERLLTLPTSGTSWERLVDDATGSWGAADISDQNSNHDVYTLAGALYAVRMNDTAMRSKVITAIESAIGTEAGGRTLALGRNLTGYVLAADLVGYRSDRFSTWLQSVRSEPLDGKTLISTHEERPNNWGTHAGAARIAADRYLGDDNDLARAVTVFQGYLGDRSAYAGFKFGDPEWQAEGTPPVPINPKGSIKRGVVVDGAIVDDVRRCACAVTSPAPRENYQWEAMQGIVTQAELLGSAGYQGVWGWSDAAIRRAAEFLYQQADFPAEGDDSFLTYLIDANIGTAYSAGVDERSGKSIGYTGWTHGTQSDQPVTTIRIVTIPPATTTATTTPTTTATTIPIVTIPPATTTDPTTTAIVTIAPATTAAPTTAPTTVPIVTIPPAVNATDSTVRTSATSGASASRIVAGQATGSFQDTWTRGAGSHTILEQESSGRTSRRHDLAELRWTIPAIGGEQVLDVDLTVGPDSGDRDAGFSIEWSTNGTDWTPIALVASGTKLDFSVAIGAPTSDVHVRVIDPDRSRGQRRPDWVSVDFLQIRAAD